MIQRALALLVIVTTCPASDWPQLLGPSRNGISDETNISLNWPKDGPRVIWKARVGEGWSSPVIASNRALLFHRVGDEALLQCWNATNGQSIWRAAYKTDYRDDFGFEEGPRATPVIEGGRVFTFGAEGMLAAWQFSDGAPLWRVDTAKELRSDKGFFGRACSPLIEGNAIILNLGGADGAGIVAFDKANGKVLWKATDQEASYSSPVTATIAGKRKLFVLGRSALVALDPLSGTVFWEHPFRPRIAASVTAAVPLVIAGNASREKTAFPNGALVFISASYSAGAQLLNVTDAKPEVVWKGDDILSNHYATSVHRGGFLYGFDGRQEQGCKLRCVELKTGKTRWSEDRFGAGTLLVAGDRLLILSERGELVVAAASPEKFQVLARTQILGFDCRAHPALANGYFYARDKTSLVCVGLRSR